MVMRWDGFLGHMGASFSDVIQGKKKWPEGISDKYGEEFGDFPTLYNGMLDRMASVFKQMEERLRSLFKQRDSLKKMIFLYKKYIPDEMLQRMNEKDVDDVVSRKQEVSCLNMELVSFLEPINELYPQVVTDELNDLHVFLKEEVVKKGGVINYSGGYRINIVYGVPKADDVSFNMACNGAQKIQQWIEERNNSDRNLSGVKWNVKFGLTHGVAITGIVGFDYMVIGDVIERSSKMLEFAKRFDVPLITDSQNMLKKSDTFKHRKLDIVTEGKSSTRSIFEVFLKKNDMIDQAIKLYNHALEMFYDEKYEVAVLEFKKVVTILDEDKPSRIFLSRCERAIKGRKGPSISS
jgi:adenylate cyclase